MKKYLRAIALTGGISALALAAAATPASAVAFLSRTGSGSACTLLAPCANMTNAVSVAGAGGEVICLDKFDYGSTTFNQSVTISCGNGLWEAPFGTIIMNAPAGSDVVIEGLVADGATSFGTGILMNNQGTLHLRRVRVGNYSGSGNHGLLFQPSGPATLHITDSVFYNNSGGSGVLIKPVPGGSANVHIRNVRFEHNLHGLFADGTASSSGINVNIAESAFVDNQGNGIGAFTGTAPVTVSVTTSQITGNFTNGIGVLGTGGAPVAVKIGNSQITGNVTGIATAGTGQIFTTGGNDLHSNGADGTFTGSIAKK